MDWIQQIVNGLALGSIYALIALGYTMVYGVLRFINFAHADVLMLGAYAAFFIAPLSAKVAASVSALGIGMFGNGSMLAGWMIGAGPVIGALLVVFIAAAICAVIGMVIELLAYRPLRDRPKLTVLITAIGVSLFIEFACQHEKLFGAATRRFPELIPQRDIVLGAVHLSSTDLIVLVLTGVILFILWFIVQKTKIGMALRALSFNQQAAALMGVSVNRVISFTFGLGSALAAVAGILYAMRAPGIDPLMGVQPGLRAFVAAVLGGIGNLPGAALGGIVLGLIETVAGGMPGVSNYRDGIAFAILILILLFRPAGLLGKATVEKV